VNAGAANPPPLRPADRLRLATVLGLTAGLLEAALRGVQRFNHQFTWVSSDVVWVAPAVGVAVLLVLAALLPSIARLVPGARPLRLFVLLGLLVIGVPVLLSYDALHPAAAVLLAAGLGVQLSAMAANHGERVLRGARVAWPWLAAFTLALALWVRFGGPVAAAIGRAEPVAARAGAPNILLIVLDTVRAASLSVNGYGRPTSRNLERLAQRGAYFERAVATSSWTLPSHASVFTGRYPHEVSADWRRPLDDAHPTLAAVTAAKGYETAGIVANTLYATTETGLARGFAEYDDYRLTLPIFVKTSLVARQAGRVFGLDSGMTTLTSRRTANEINAAFFGWLARRDQATAARPFFVFLNYMDAHGPYRPPGPFAKQFGAEGPPPDIEMRRAWTASDIEHERNAYDGSIAFLDHQVGNLVDELERLGLLSNTIVAIVSDHGELVGEHGLYDHGNSLYWRVLHVPLLIVYPTAVPAGLRIKTPVTLRDLPGTLLDIAEIRPAGWPGKSLNRFWGGQRDAGPASPLLSEMSRGINLNPWLPASRGDMKSLIEGSLHYIRNGDGVEELYDIGRDPEEKQNLAGSDAAAIERFRAALQKALTSGSR
jgi:arylsulfatase A-like enzyme